MWVGYNGKGGRTAKLQAWLRWKEVWETQGECAGRVMVSASSVSFQLWKAGTESRKQAMCGCGKGAQSKTHGSSNTAQHPLTPTPHPHPPKNRDTWEGPKKWWRKHQTQMAAAAFLQSCTRLIKKLPWITKLVTWLLCYEYYECYVMSRLKYKKDNNDSHKQY